MAFSAGAFVPRFIGGSGFGKEWDYYTADTLATCMASGYFTPISSSAPAIGELIWVHVVDAVAIASRTSATGAFPVMVATNNGTTITTTVSAVSGGFGGIVDTTATTLAVTQALHAGRTVTISSAAPIAITLPQATGTGAKYKFVIQVAATATAHTIKVANATDVMEGLSLGLTTASPPAFIGFTCSATSDTITINGTTTGGGVVGDMVEIEDVKTGFFSVKVRGLLAGTTTTFVSPFSATVS